MSTPVRLCVCDHGQRTHHEDDDCLAPGCDCTEYIPNDLLNLEKRPIVVARAPAEEPTTVRRSEPANVEQSVIAAGKRSEYKRTVALAEKVAELVESLRERLRDEQRASEAKRRHDAEAEGARRELAALEAQIKAIKAKLRGGASNTETATAATGSQTCPDCGKGGLVNLGAHRFKAHGKRAAS